MQLFNRSTVRTVDPTSTIELLFFDCVEVSASRPMQETVGDCCTRLGVSMQTIDVWLDPDAVLRHRLLIVPAIIVLADGEEIHRLVGPRSCRQVERFFAKTLGAPMTAPLVAA